MRIFIRYFEYKYLPNGKRMETTNEVKETLEIKKSRRSLVIDFTDKARRNLRRQQGDYQSKHGKKINLKKLAGKLLETAKLPDTE